MARSKERYAFITLLGLALCSPAVLGKPFLPQEYVLQQAALSGSGHGHDDPLKSFISDVVQDDTPIGSGSSDTTIVVAVDGTTSTTTTTLSVPAPLSSSISSSSSPSSLRYASPPDEEEFPRPSWFTSTLLARRLLAKSSIGITSTVYQSAASAGLQGIPISLPEYIADCSDDSDPDAENNGNPILLGLYVSTTFRNVAQGSNISLSIDWWDHLKDTEPVYPDFPLSEAGLPRVSLIGYVERVDLSSEEQKEDIEECFLASHPDAEVWLPGNKDSPHGGFWARLVVTQAYWIGGFGDLQQIGWINMTEWRGIGRFGSADGIGDGSGRGWEDVRLPGEAV